MSIGSTNKQYPNDNIDRIAKLCRMLKVQLDRTSDSIKDVNNLLKKII